MRKTRKRPRRGPSPGWECALARLEDRLLLSGSTSADDRPVMVEVASTRAGGPQTVAPAGFGTDVQVGGVDLIGSPSQQTIDPEGGGGGGGDGSFTPSGGAGGTSAPTVSTGFFIGPVFSPTVPGTSTGVLGVVGGPEPGPVLIGAAVGPQAGGIQPAVLRPMESFYLSYSPLDSAAMGILPTAGGGACASMASIVGEGVGEAIEAADLADPPAPPQRAAASDLAVIHIAGAEAVAGVAAVPPAAVAVDVEAAPTEAPVAPESPSAEDETAEEAPPEPIGVGLRMTAPLIDVAGWDAALARLVEGVDGLVEAVEDLGAEPTYLPWAVAAGLMVTASEAARRARSRPSLAAAFVDGSVSVVDPDDGPRASPLGSSVRRLLARGLSRWTTRR